MPNLTKYWAKSKTIWAVIALIIITMQPYYSHVFDLLSLTDTQRTTAQMLIALFIAICRFTGIQPALTIKKGDQS